MFGPTCQFFGPNFYWSYADSHKHYALKKFSIRKKNSAHDLKFIRQFEVYIISDFKAILTTDIVSAYQQRDLDFHRICYIIDIHLDRLR